MSLVSRWLVVGFGSAVLFPLCVAASAQQPTKMTRIGFLFGTSPSGVGTRMDAFRQGMRELGYIEGRNILIESRYTEGKEDREHEFAAELVRAKVDVIVTGGSSGTRAAKEATTIIPIVMTQDPDPVGNGFVASLARPGGNITGLSNLGPELTGKRLELLKEVVPGLTHAAVFGSSTFPGNAQILRETERAANVLKVQLLYLDVPYPKDIETAFRAASRGNAHAVLILAGGVFTSRRAELASLAVKNRLPAIYYATEFVEDGGLMTYGANRSELSRRAAIYVDKILKGARPADVPIEQPTKFELIINMTAAKQIGLTIPPNVLARADRVIK